MSRPEVSRSPVAYTIEIPDPRTHELHVRMVVSDVASPTRVVMPAWVPGSYLLREFARHVVTLDAADASGDALPCRKVARNAWEIEHDGQFVVSYRFDAQDHSVRTTYLDHRYGVLTGGNFVMAVEGEEHRPVQVDVVPPAGWVAFSPAFDGFVGRRFERIDYHALVDTFIVLQPASDHRVHRFEALGRPHAFLFLGQHRFDEDAIVHDTARVVRAGAAYFGNALPYQRYGFALMAADRRSGLEHADGTVLSFPATRAKDRADHQDLLLLIAHEHFHAWNVKRVHTDVFDAYDYSRENLTRDLWVAEGWTSYFQSRVMLDAGLMSLDELLVHWGKRLRRHTVRPGRHLQGLEDASFDAWVKHYRRDGNSPNTSVSYYLKGSIVALLLDVEIRHRTSDAKGLGDVLLHLWETFGARGRGYPEATIQQQVEAAVGGDFQAWFDHHVRGTGLITVTEPFARVGIRCAYPPDRGTAELGVVWGTGSLVKTVYRGGPAESAGLTSEDELVAIDGFRVLGREPKELLMTFSPGDEVDVAWFRRGRLHSGRLTLGGRRLTPTMLSVDEDAPPEAVAKRAAWLGLRPSIPKAAAPTPTRDKAVA